MSSGLPSGQHAIDAFPRWGLPRFVQQRPALPARVRLRLGGAVAHAHEIGDPVLASVPRREQLSDLHCVTTWTRRGLRWGGWRLCDVYEQVIVPRARPYGAVRVLVFHGLDGYRSHLSLEDALAADVLLADELDGRPLTPAHGAPLRLVAPAHYGYKSAKHLCGLDCWTDPHDPSTQDWREHPRARVNFEERGKVLPGWALRAIYRAFLPLMMRAYLGAPQREAGAPSVRRG